MAQQTKRAATQPHNERTTHSYSDIISATFESHLPVLTESASLVTTLVCYVGDDDTPIRLVASKPERIPVVLQR